MEKLLLNHDKQCECAKDHFCSFIQDNGNFDKEEKDYLLHKIIDTKITGVLYVSSVLVTWGFVSSWVDGIILPATALYSIIEGKITFDQFLPVLLFFSINLILKIAFIIYSLRSKINFINAFLAIIPYVGPLLLMRNYIKNDPILKKGITLFLNNKKKELINKVRGLFRKK